MKNKNITVYEVGFAPAGCFAVKHTENKQQWLKVGLRSLDGALKVCESDMGNSLDFKVIQGGRIICEVLP